MRTPHDSRPAAAQADQAMQQAMSLHQAGRLAEAAAIYEQVLAHNPAHARAMHGLGIIARQKGNLAKAVQLLERATNLNPGVADFHLSLAQAHHEAGDLRSAEKWLRRALQLATGNPAAHHFLGLVLGAVGRWQEAAAEHQEAVRLRPDFSAAQLSLGTALVKSGNLRAAISAYRRALELDPQNAAGWQNLGAALAARDEFAEAAECFRKAIAIQPDERMYLDLGRALKLCGDVEGALAAFQKAIDIRPDLAPAHLQAGLTLRELGRLEQSIAAFRQASELQPRSTQASVELGIALALHDQAAEAAQCLERAVWLNANEALACCRLAWQAISAEQLPYLRPVAQATSSDLLRVELTLALPHIYASAEEIRTCREKVASELDQLHERRVRVDVSETCVAAPFSLAYHGYNDRDLQKQIASLYTAPPVPASAPGQGQRIRIGFISKYFRNHTIGGLNQGLIANLSRQDFEVTVLAIGSCNEPMAQAIRRSADRSIELPDNLALARKKIAELELDVLFYTDIGMDPMSYTLALSRLAPVQCVTWGHPLTTGMPSMDYFISSELLEGGPAAQEHYSEKLVQLKHLAVHYYRPPQPVGQRGDFALPPEKHWYTCPQSLFKLHPDFDAVIAEILRRDPQGVLVLLRGMKVWEDLLLQRWRKSVPDVVNRICFVGRLDRPRFLGLCNISDVLLDPLHFGGGNTSYEAFSVGAPIVTLPSPFLRGRITLALYKQMGVIDCVAANEEAYVELALKLGTDTAYREQIRTKIRAANGVLFENPVGVRDLEAFFQSLHLQKRS